jgi:hypothetical protein
LNKKASFVALILLPGTLVGQGALDEFSYDGLRFSGFGIEMGGVVSDRLESQLVGGIRVDYGNFSPKVRMVFGLSYFKGDFEADEIAKFERSLRRVVIDPTNDFSITVGAISLSNIEADLDLLYEFSKSPRFMTYGGVGLGVHIRNGAGAAIDGTFVEDALDTFAAGFNLILGGEVGLFSNVSVYTDARLGLSGELNMASVRAGFMVRPSSD